MAVKGKSRWIQPRWTRILAEEDGNSNEAQWLFVIGFFYEVLGVSWSASGDVCFGPYYFDCFWIFNSSSPQSRQNSDISIFYHWGIWHLKKQI